MDSPTTAWRGQKVLVTGAAGFIGSHLTEALVKAGASVRAFVRYNSRNDYGWLETCDPEVASEIEIFRGDLVNPEAVTDSTGGPTACCTSALSSRSRIPTAILENSCSLILSVR